MKLMSELICPGEKRYETNVRVSLFRRKKGMKLMLELICPREKKGMKPMSRVILLRTETITTQLMEVSCYEYSKRNRHTKILKYYKNSLRNSSFQKKLKLVLHTGNICFFLST